MSVAGWLALAGMRLAGGLVPRLPTRFLRAAADVAGLASYALAGKRRRGLVGNLSAVVDPGDPDLVALRAREAFRTQAHNYVDLFRVPRLSPGQIEAMVEIEGWEHIQAVLAAGRGGILVVAHLGNLDLVAQLVCVRGVPVTVPVEPLVPRSLFRYVSALRSAHGLRLVPADGDALAAVSAALKRGELVGFAVDRDVQGSGEPTPFLGRRAGLSHAPALLSRRRRAPVVPASAVRLPGGRFLATVHRPIWPEIGHSNSALMARALAPIEAAISQTPGQWVMFHPLFEPTEASQ